MSRLNAPVKGFHVRRIVVATIIVTIYGVLSFAPAAATLQALQPGMKAPDFSLKTLAKETRSFDDVRGDKLTVLVFWSTWSAKSGKILARMEQLYERYKDRGLAVVGVNVDEQQISAETMTGIKAFCEKLNIRFPVLIDTGLATFHAFGVIAVPTTVIMARDRKIVYSLSGFPLVGSETMIDYITAAMEGKTSQAAESKTGYQPDVKAVRFYNMGKKTLKSKRMADTAEMWFKKSIEADGAFLLPHISLGKMYLQRGQRDLAQAEFRAVLEKDPAHPIALCELGLILVDDGKVAEGTALFEKARKTEESYAPCYYYAAYAYGKEEKPEQALTLFAEAEKINPFDYHNFLYQGKVFESRHDMRQALAAYKKALAIILSLP